MNLHNSTVLNYWRALSKTIITILSSHAHHQSYAKNKLLAFETTREFGLKMKIGLLGIKSQYGGNAGKSL